ncbi:MAG: phosphatase PAP2 family protein [Stellaceae bacterium]
MSLRAGIIAYIVLAALAAALFTLDPGIDLWASGLFYNHGFILDHSAFFQFLFRLVLIVSDALAIGLPVALLIVLWRRRPLHGFDKRALIFLILAFAIGPGVVVNTVLKDHWGRARPVQVTEFGGTREFTPALEPTDQCPRNCSFPAGHPALGFYFFAFALLIPAAGKRRIAFAAVLAAGALLGVMRIGQGGHFLSDVVFSGFIIIGITWLLHALIMRLRLGEGAAAWQQIALTGLVCAITIVLCYFFYDRPVATQAHRLGREAFILSYDVTNFGKSGSYLIVTAALFAGLQLAALRAARARLAGMMRFFAWQAAFLFVTIAISGLATDLLKVIFGRARPKLYFADHLYGFFHDRLYGYSWHGSRADFWSFPSGHATTASAIALSLTYLWPRLWPAWWLFAIVVMASRLGVGAHYPGDLIGGFYIALLTVWGMRAGFDRLGITLRAKSP